MLLLSFVVINVFIVLVVSDNENKLSGNGTDIAKDTIINLAVLHNSEVAKTKRATTTATTTTTTTTTKKTELYPSWNELEKRIIPSWYDESKIGIFIHYGVFSVPSYKSEWFEKYWYGDHITDYVDYVDRTEQHKGSGETFSYAEYASRLSAIHYDPYQWSHIFAQSGAQYIVLTSKHHDGYCMWNSTNLPLTYNWNVMDVGPRRDIVGELSEAVKQTISPHTNRTLKFGLYHSLYEWFHPMYINDKKNNFTTQDFVNEKTLPELYDIVNKYEPELIWSDGQWEAPSTYWKSLEFLYWYSTNSTVAKTAIWNDRWGNDTNCTYGSYITCRDRYHPNKIQNKKYENAFTIDKTTWGYSHVSNYSNYMTTYEIITTMIETIAFNGNVLINVGPDADGTIHPIFVDRLYGLGDWLRVNGVAIYDTKPWLVCQNETRSNVFYTMQPKTKVLYAIFTKWPKNSLLYLNCPTFVPDETTIKFLGLDDDSHESILQYNVRQSNANDSPNNTKPDDAPPFRQRDMGIGTSRRVTEQKRSKNEAAPTWNQAEIEIELPSLTPDVIPCDHAWVLAISPIVNHVTH